MPTPKTNSRGGLAVILRQGFKRGTYLIVDLATNAGELRRIPAQVVHARYEIDARWVVGCAFTPHSESKNCTISCVAFLRQLPRSSRAQLGVRLISNDAR